MNSRMRLLPFAVFLFILPFSGTVALRLLALASGLAVCAWSWHKDGFPQVPARNALLFWAGCALLSLATAFDPAYSLGEIKNEVGYSMAAYLGFFTLTRSRNDAAFFVTVLVLGNLALALLALWEYFSSPSTYWNERGLAGGSGSYSTYLLALLPVLLWAGYVLSYRHRWGLISGLIALQLVVAVLTGQRAFWLVFALQALGALYLMRARGFIAISARRAQAIGAAAVLVSILAVVGAASTRVTVPWAEDPRVTTWAAVSERILEHPLTGMGFGRQTMKSAYPDLVSQKFPLFWHPHNLFLNYGIAMGIPGVIALVLLFLALLRRFLQMSRAEDRASAMAGICGVLLVAGVVARNLSNDFFQRDLALLFWAVAGMFLGYAQHANIGASAPVAPDADPAGR
jgi:O-antigen ligase